MSNIFQVDLSLQQGADFSPAAGASLATTQPWVLNNAIVNLTGYTTQFLIKTLSTDVAPWLTLTQTPNTNGSSAIPQGSAGTVIITITAADSLILPASLGPLIYNLLLFNAGATIPLQGGRIFLTGLA